MVNHSQYTKSLSKFTAKNILVVGDVIVDQYTYGISRRISPEAPVPIVLIDKKETKAGGAGNVALNLACLGMNPRILSRVGNDENGELLRQILEKECIDCQYLFIDKQVKTPIKNRVIVQSQQLLRIDDERKDVLSQEIENMMIESIADIVQDIDVIAISDYAKGMLSDRLLQAIIQKAKEDNILCITDPKGTDFRKYTGSTIIKPNFSEAMAVFGAQATTLAEATGLIFDKVDIDMIMVTRSEKGISLYYKDGLCEEYPVTPKEVRDVTGAGDTVLAVLAAALACAIPLHQAIPLANIAASCAIEKIGCASITLADIAMRVIEQNPTGKICSEEIFRAISVSLHQKKILLIRIAHSRRMTHDQMMKIHLAVSKKSQDMFTAAYVEEASPDEEFLEFLASLERIDIVVHKTSHSHCHLDPLQELPILYEEVVI